MRKECLEKWVDDQDMMLVWLIGGEKRMYSNRSYAENNKVSEFGGMYYLSEDGVIEGESWKK